MRPHRVPADERPRKAAPKGPLRPARRDCAQREGASVSSIRLRLLVSLVALLVLVAVAMAAITYRNVLGETEAIFDYQLQLERGQRRAQLVRGIS